MPAKHKESVSGNKTRANAGHYSEKDKLRAVAAMRAIGQEHMQSDRAMAAARAVLGQDIPRGTLARWAVKYAPLVDKLKPALNPALIDRSAIIQEAQENVIDRFIGIRDKAAILLDNTANLEKATPQQQAIIMGIAQTHISAMTALPADALQISQQLYRLCERYNDSYVDLMKDYYATYEAQHNGIAIKAESE